MQGFEVGGSYPRQEDANTIRLTGDTTLLVSRSRARWPDIDSYRCRMTRMANSSNKNAGHDAPVSGVVLAAQAVGDDEEDTILIRQMAKDAVDYCSGFSWCKSVKQVYFGGGLGGVFCVYLLSIVPSRDGIGHWMWVVRGDIPPVYLPLEDCDSPKAVFETYLWGMGNWVELAKHGKTSLAEDGVPPVKIPATPENAAMLEKRLKTLKSVVAPFFAEQQIQ